MAQIRAMRRRTATPIEMTRSFESSVTSSTFPSRNAADEDASVEDVGRADVKVVLLVGLVVVKVVLLVVVVLVVGVVDVPNETDSEAETFSSHFQR